MKAFQIAFFAWIVGSILILVYMYVANPFNTSSYDPRARVLGFSAYSIASKSMTPTLQVGDYILVKTSAYSTEVPEINDVIVFKYPENRNQDFVMRVVARESERMAMSNGIMYVDGKKIDQSYLDLNNTIKSNSIDLNLNVPKGQLFVLGDNRDHSNDSRYWGFVPIEDVVGKAILIWMSDDIGRIGKNIE